MPLRATALSLILRPARSAASMPAMTWEKSPQRVMALKRSAFSVSSEMLMRRTPRSLSSSAYFGSWLPLVVSVNSSSASDRKWRERAWKSQMMFLRTSGSPPVMRIFLTPLAMNTEQSRSSSSSVSKSFLGRKVMCSDMQ